MRFVRINCKEPLHDFLAEHTQLEVRQAVARAPMHAEAEGDVGSCIRTISETMFGISRGFPRSSCVNERFQFGEVPGRNRHPLRHVPRLVHADESLPLKLALFRDARIGNGDTTVLGPG